MQPRPIHKNPLKIHLPVQAWISIGHRMSGLVVFLLIPLLLLALDVSVASAEGFALLQAFSEKMGLEWLFWIVFAALLFHLLAGIRHLLMDIHWGESKKASHYTAYAVLVLFLLLCLGTYGFWG